MLNSTKDARHCESGNRTYGQENQFILFIEHHLQSKIIIESESNHRMRSSDAHVDHILKCLVEIVADPAR